MYEPAVTILKMCPHTKNKLSRSRFSNVIYLLCKSYQDTLKNDDIKHRKTEKKYTKTKINKNKTKTKKNKKKQKKTKMYYVLHYIQTGPKLIPCPLDGGTIKS